MLRAPVFLINLAMLFVLTGCRRDYSWSADSVSPDGRFVAHAYAYAGSTLTGFGVTTVSLKSTSDSRVERVILHIGSGDSGPVGLKWISPTQLELTYGGGRSNYSAGLQAAKCYGVNISVRKRSVSSPVEAPKGGTPR